MVFARSKRSMVRVAAAAFALTLLLGAASAWLFSLHDDLGALVLGMLGVVALAVVARMALRLRRWPARRLGFFRDRLVLVLRSAELQAPWDHVQTATLAAQGDWTVTRWPEIDLTDRLTVRLGSRRRFSFRPAAFGLEPAACRDLILRLRDDRALRERLPEFDSRLDVLQRPLHTGELIRPQL